MAGGWEYRSAQVMFRRILPLLTLVLAATGCVSRPPASLVQPWPDPPPPGYATFLFYSPQRAMGHGPSIYVDDVKPFEPHWASYSWTYVRAGQHTIRTKWMVGLRGLNSTNYATFQAGTNYYVKLVNSSRANPAYVTVYSGLTFVSGETAKKECTTCWYYPALFRQIDHTAELPLKQ